MLLTLVLASAHLMAVWFTDARGSWLIGVPAGMVALLALPVIFDALTSMVRQRALTTDLLVLTCLVIVLTMAVLAAQLDVIGVLDFSGVATVRTLAVLAGCGKTLLSTQGRKLSDDKRRPIACSERIIRIGLSHAECRRDS